MTLYDKIVAYKPYNEQEERDQKAMLSFINRNPDYLLRTNLTAHFSASSWVVNKSHDKILLIYHNIYDSWSWTGGHADGEENLSAVALRELSEETGVQKAKLLSEEIFSLEVLTVDGHIKRGEYVPSHLHMNLSYLIEADEEETLKVKPDENSGVRWIKLEEMENTIREKWMKEWIYQKLNQKLHAMDQGGNGVKND